MHKFIINTISNAIHKGICEALDFSFDDSDNNDFIKKANNKRGIHDEIYALDKCKAGDEVFFDKHIGYNRTIGDNVCTCVIPAGIIDDKPRFAFKHLFSDTYPHALEIAKENNGYLPSLEELEKANEYWPWCFGEGGYFWADNEHLQQPDDYYKWYFDAYSWHSGNRKTKSGLGSIHQIILFVDVFKDSTINESMQLPINTECVIKAGNDEFFVSFQKAIGDYYYPVFTELKRNNFKRTRIFRNSNVAQDFINDNIDKFKYVKDNLCIVSYEQMQDEISDVEQRQKKYNELKNQEKIERQKEKYQYSKVKRLEDNTRNSENNPGTYEVRFFYVQSPSEDIKINVYATSINDAFIKAKEKAIAIDPYCAAPGYDRKLKFSKQYIRKIK